MKNTVETLLLISHSSELAKSLQKSVRDFPDFRSAIVAHQKQFQKCKEGIQDHSYQLIILDARKQNLSPLEMGIEISSLTKSSPLIILNEPGHESQAINCLKSGASDYILTLDGWLDNLPYAMLHVLEEHTLKDQRKKEINKLRNELFELRELRTRLMSDSQPLLYPKNKFRDLFLSEAKRAQRHHFDLSCLVFEIPQTRDEEALQAEFIDGFSQLLPHVVRKSDYWTNLKPGVFAAILPHTSKKQAKEAAQRISGEIIGELPKDLHKKSKVQWKISTFNHKKDLNLDQAYETALSEYQ